MYIEYAQLLCVCVCVCVGGWVGRRELEEEWYCKYSTYVHTYMGS